MDPQILPFVVDQEQPPEQVSKFCDSIMPKILK